MQQKISGLFLSTSTVEQKSPAQSRAFLFCDRARYGKMYLVSHHANDLLQSLRRG